MLYQLVWATKDETEFEQSVPLLWHAKHIAERGWQNRIKVGFMEGLDRLSSQYRIALDKSGYDVFDCSAQVKSALSDHPQLGNFNTLNRYWFLRWNVLKQLAEQHPETSTIVHLDADIVFFADPNEIYKDVEGKTFVLQGCPVFTAISDRSWFEVWCRELAAFLERPEEYQEEALSIKCNPIRNPREYCNILAYQAGRFHDQDMLEYLVAAGKLPQARTETVFDSAFYWMQNPLFPGEWHYEQCANAMKHGIHRDGGFYVGNKPLAFCHFQSDFARFCSDWMFLKRYGLNRLASTGHIRTDFGKTSLFSRLFMKSVRAIKGTREDTRRNVLETVFKIDRHTRNPFVTEIINSSWD